MLNNEIRKKKMYPFKKFDKVKKIAIKRIKIKFDKKT
jgi:hypothetical protein